MKTETFTILATDTTLQDDPARVIALWRDECQRVGGLPVGEPTWRVVTEDPAISHLFTGPVPDMLRVEGAAMRTRKDGMSE